MLGLGSAAYSFQCGELCDVEIKSLLCLVLNFEIDGLDSPLVCFYKVESNT